MKRNMSKKGLNRKFIQKSNVKNLLFLKSNLIYIHLFLYKKYIIKIIIENRNYRNF